MACKIACAWHPHEDAIIEKGIAQNWTWGRIAADLPGRTSRTARLRADRLKIRPVRKVTDGKPIGCGGSARLLVAMRREFERHATRHRIAPRPNLGLGCADIARLLLMNCRERV